MLQVLSAPAATGRRHMTRGLSMVARQGTTLGRPSRWAPGRPSTARYTIHLINEALKIPGRGSFKTLDHDISDSVPDMNDFRVLPDRNSCYIS